MHRFYSLFVAVSLLPSLAWGDEIQLRNGEVLSDCVVLKRTEKDVVVMLDYGLLTVPAKDIIKLSSKSLPKPAASKTADGPKTISRLPRWSGVVSSVVSTSWISRIDQIPATVIDSGVFKNTPYMSFKCDENIELNVYGDPDNPCAIEIGIRRVAAKDLKLRRKATELLAGMLRDKEDAKRVLAANPEKDISTDRGLTIEVTPVDAEDAYDAWWVSVYFAEAVATATAPPELLSNISIAKSVKKLVNPVEPKVPALPAPTETPAPAPSVFDWSVDEMRFARTEQNEPTSGGGRVWVRAYRKKDGTYVSGHSRRR